MSLDPTKVADSYRLAARGEFERPATWAEQACAVAHGRDDLAEPAVALADLTAYVEPHPFGRRVVLRHEFLPEHDPDHLT